MTCAGGLSEEPCHQSPLKELSFHSLAVMHPKEENYTGKNMVLFLFSSRVLL